MSKTLDINQEIGVSIDWKKLAKDLIEEFKIDTSEDDIEEFCVNNEINYLSITTFEQNIKETQTNDLSGDEEVIQ